VEESGQRSAFGGKAEGDNVGQAKRLR